MMMRNSLTAFAVTTILVAPAIAQEQSLTVEDYIKTQMLLLNGMTELLNNKNIAESPAEVADAVKHLTQYAVALVSLKGQLNADDLAAAQGNLEVDPAAQATGAAFVAAVHSLAEKNFYNSNELATAVQQFLAVLANM